MCADDVDEGPLRRRLAALDPDGMPLGRDRGQGHRGPARRGRRGARLPHLAGERRRRARPGDRGARRHAHVRRGGAGRGCRRRPTRWLDDAVRRGRRRSSPSLRAVGRRRVPLASRRAARTTRSAASRWSAVTYPPRADAPGVGSARGLGGDAGGRRRRRRGRDPRGRRAGWCERDGGDPAAGACARSATCSRTGSATVRTSRRRCCCRSGCSRRSRRSCRACRWPGRWTRRACRSRRLFLWVQVLHAFDVPRRRDLSFSMVSSVILMAEAGALSLSTTFVLFLIPWAVLDRRVAVPLEPAAGRRDAAASSVRRSPRPGGTGASIRGAVWAGSSVRARDARSCSWGSRVCRAPLVRSLPFSLGGAASAVANFAGGVENPSLPAASGDGVVDFAPDGYPGFSDVVDLRARGHLSDEVAFRVRAPQAALWRAEAFDTFDGTMWTISDPSTDPLLPSDAHELRDPSRSGSTGCHRPRADRALHADVLHRHAAAQRPVRRLDPRAGVLPVGRPGGGSLRLDPVADPAGRRAWSTPSCPMCR